MLRTAERRATSPADELLDRTGILAASVPRGRRSPEDTQPIPAVPALLPIAGDGASASVLAPLAPRPRAVARRRTRGWVAGTAALALLALGWLAGGLFSGSFAGRTTDDVAVSTDQHELVAPAPPRPAPASTPAAPAAPPAAPVTVYVPVPDHKAATPAKQHVAGRPTTPRSSGGGSDHRPTSTPDDDLRSDTKSTPGKSPAATQFDEYITQWRPWLDLADRMSRR
ncbi:hypothetical protein AB0F91_18830 [Amycolatopsis sp. NPDC023774]|uniref:hypothetical protein n=1 Tax=Amycolatopsis sp. NPDC023774 TaxID=3155015 RepID=UPI0033F0D2FD